MGFFATPLDKDGNPVGPPREIEGEIGEVGKITLDTFPLGAEDVIDVNDIRRKGKISTKDGHDFYFASDDGGKTFRNATKEEFEARKKELFPDGVPGEEPSE